MSDDELDDLFSRLPPMSDAEKFEVMAHYFNAVLKAKSTAELKAFRVHLLTLHPGDPTEAVAVEIIDGLLALREIQGEPPLS